MPPPVEVLLEKDHARCGDAIDLSGDAELVPFRVAHHDMAEMLAV